MISRVPVSIAVLEPGGATGIFIDVAVTVVVDLVAGLAGSRVHGRIEV